MQAKSPSKLVNQQPDLLGFAELSVLTTTVEFDGMGVNQTVKCMVKISNDSTVIERQTHCLNLEHNMQWNSEFEFRCGVRWNLEINMIITDSKGENNLIVTTESIPIDDIGNTSQLLFLFDTCVGEVNFTLDFFPNHSSFRCLAVDCTLHNTLSLNILNELLTLVTHMHSEQNDEQNVDTVNTQSIRDSERNQLTKAIHTVIGYLTHPNTLSSHLRSLYCKSMRSSSFSLQNSPSNNNNSNGQCEKTSPAQTPRQNNNSPSNKEQCNFNDIRLPLSKLASISRVFLTKLMDNIPQSPQVSMELIEKQLTIYNASVMNDVNLQQSVNTYMINSKISTNSTIQLSPRLPLDSSPIDKYVYEWKHLLSFCIISALWLLQQAHSINSLLNEQNALVDLNEVSKNLNNNDDNHDEFSAVDERLTLKELDTLRFVFSIYDRDLSGEIPASDVYFLLQDMGCEYTPEEIDLILHEINPDSHCTVDFEDFVRWWCEE